MVLLVARESENCKVALLGPAPVTAALNWLTLAVKLDNPDRSRTACATPVIFVPLGSSENAPFVALRASAPPSTKETRVVATMPPMVLSLKLFVC